MTDFLTADTNLPSYMMFPRFLLDMEINETAKMLYIILLDRARLSQKNEGWSDIDGHVFIYFTNPSVGTTDKYLSIMPVPIKNLKT